MIGGSNAHEQLAELQPWPVQAPGIGSAERLQRLARARDLTLEAGAEALLVVAGASLNYFCGVTWRLSERLVALIVTPAGTPVLIAPKFEEGSLAAVLELDVEIRFWEEEESPFALVADVFRERSVKCAALDPSMPFAMAAGLARAEPGVRAIDGTSVIEGCRMIKSPAELRLLRQAKQMTLEVQRRAALILRPGIRASEVTRFIDSAHRALGSAGSAFCIAQFGVSTSFPHGLPQDDVLEEGDMVLIDTGCAVRGYNSDITRSYVFGRPSATQRRIWEIEHEAQQAAFDVARPGVTCEEVDNSARRVLEHHGLGPDYQLPGLPHRTGHGIGLSIHEAPYLVRGDRTVLAPGMCLSNEPTIVVPSEFGVRLEDHFYVTETGAEWFTEPSVSIDAPFSTNSSRSMNAVASTPA